MDPQDRLITPRGSSIEAIGPDTYRVCDRSRHCREVKGLWEAQQLVQYAESHHQPIDLLP
jgi:hypothetical protein